MLTSYNSFHQIALYKRYQSLKCY